MRMFLILSPFALLSAMLALTSPVVAVFTAAAWAGGLVAHDMWHGRSLKLLQAATAALLAAIGTDALLIHPHLGSNAARVILDGGLLVVVAAALVMGRPFTSQYARETVDAATAARPEFHRANQLLTVVWIVAFAMMLAADVTVIYLPELPFWTGLAAVFAARNGAASFTQWYAARRRQIAARRGPTPSLLPATGDVT